MIFLIIFSLLIVGLIIWFFIKNKERSVENTPIEEPPKDESITVEEPNIEEPTKEELPKEEEIPLENFYMIMGTFEYMLEMTFGPKTTEYLKELYIEAYKQFHLKDNSKLPLLLMESNFPPFDPLYGSKGIESNAFGILVYWLFALQLSEIIPDKREIILKTGYADYNTTLYGYSFRHDPHVARITAGIIYAGMRGLLNPDIDSMRKEFKSKGIPMTLEEVRDSNSLDFSKFYVDLRNFMPNAPGPYAPHYKDLPKTNVPKDDKDDLGNLIVDKLIHEYVVSNVNLPSSEAVQAIADKEADMHHIFGNDMNSENYTWSPAFTFSAIDPEGPIAYLCEQCMYISSYAREILQDRMAGLYGRLRPGCSWTHEAIKNDAFDNRRNVLTCFEIEDNDGNPTGYYNEDGKWTKPNEIGSPEEYEEMQRNALWANSYPSGHSAGITGVAMVLAELFPDKCDIILKEMNTYALHRVYARYHWFSDTIIGREIGTLASALCRATTNFNNLLKTLKL